VSKEGTGYYCFKVPGVRSAVANVSDGGSGIAHGLATVAVGPGAAVNSGCPSGQGFTVGVQTSAEGVSTFADTDLPFFVWFQ
jgi:hypothetical protein